MEAWGRARYRNKAQKLVDPKVDNREKGGWRGGEIVKKGGKDELMKREKREGKDE